jgi:two-component system phosphate regulon sensor histidine kinase PhoR
MVSLIEAVALVVAVVVAIVLVRRERRQADELRAEIDARVPRDELEATVASFEALLEAAPTPVIQFDRHGRVQRANAAAVAAFPDGEMPAALAPVIDEVLTGAATVVDREIAVEQPVRRRWEAHLRAQADGALAVLVDVTAAGDFREARRLFSAAVSHELRTPLARILGLAETLGLPQTEAERETLVVQIEVEVEGMRGLIDEMLLLAALDRGEIPTGDQADAGAAAEPVVADRRARRAWRNRELRFMAARAQRVAVAPRLLEVVLGNLLDNALFHAGDDAIVSVDVRPAGGNVEIAVSDTGVGIAPEHLPHVFERFYRAEASRAGTGTGLGLAVVKHIVEAHGGRVSADSQPGSGTTVRLILPRVTPGEAAATA